MSKKINNEKLSKIVSHALRHKPEVYEIKLDAEGWVMLQELCEAIRKKGPEFNQLEVEDILGMVISAKKQRHEIKDGMIRAIYGHSTHISPVYKPMLPPPSELYHGTSKEAVSEILEEGLKPMNRLYVHLSSDKGVAYTVGKRKSGDPIILKVRAGEADKQGIKFYCANKDVWLSEFIPSKFIDMEI